MLQLVGRTGRVCDGIHRRQLLEAGGAGLLGLSLPKLLAAEAAQPARRPRAKSVVFLFLFGGPSQLETWDMKPDAPSTLRGPFQPIAARTPGLRVCEHLPRCAAISDKFAVIKTMTHGYNDHSGGGHYIQTGHKWHLPIGGGFNVTPEDWPSMGSVVKWTMDKAGTAARDIPPYVVVPNFLGRLQEYRTQLRRPGETAGWLGRAYDPLNTRIDKRDAKDNPYFRDCTDDELRFEVEGLEERAGITLNRLQSRRSLLDQFDDERRLADRSARVAAFDQFRQQAMALVSSPKTREAFDIRQEPSDVRDRYGRNLFGQSTLVARRLVEAGVRFTTVHYDAVDGYSWDSHISSEHLEKHLIPGLDCALSALLTDLDDRGLLDETLVVAMGEMGRTPSATGKWGRGHWSTLFPAVVAGAGIRGGVIFGETDKDAAYPVSHPVSPEDLAATIYHALGIDHTGRIYDVQGRPHEIVASGTPVLSLFG
ncbi:MAG: DUF1501 domain-containing protein [Pirellulaceae bacterium]